MGMGERPEPPFSASPPKNSPPPQSPGKGSNTHAQSKSCAWKIPGSGVLPHHPAPRPLLPQPPPPPLPAAVSIATDVARRQLSRLIHDRAA